MTWGLDEMMEGDLHDESGMLVTNRVYQNKGPINTELDYLFPWIKGKRGKIYFICWNNRMNDKLSSHFSKNRSIENGDFLLILPPPQTPVYKLIAFFVLIVLTCCSCKKEACSW